jgi:hypothetical protein
MARCILPSGRRLLPCGTEVNEAASPTSAGSGLRERLPRFAMDFCDRWIQLISLTRQAAGLRQSGRAWKGSRVTRRLPGSGVTTYGGRAQPRRAFANSRIGSRSSVARCRRVRPNHRRTGRSAASGCRALLAPEGDLQTLPYVCGADPARKPGVRSPRLHCAENSRTIRRLGSCVWQEGWGNGTSGDSRAFYCRPSLRLR